MNVEWLLIKGGIVTGFSFILRIAGILKMTARPSRPAGGEIFTAHFPVFTYRRPEMAFFRWPHGISVPLFVS